MRNSQKGGWYIMKCPFCGATTKVVDSRPTEEGQSIRRRRECEECAKRFTTFEKIEAVILRVIKKDGTRESFDRDKTINGIIRACEKRSVPLDAIEKIVSDLEQGMTNAIGKELSSTDIGEFVMGRLKDLDAVAYVRFASVYRQFTEAENFKTEVENLSRNKRND
jgi:transcriptional repressor NrdR